MVRGLVAAGLVLLSALATVNCGKGTTPPLTPSELPPPVSLGITCPLVPNMQSPDGRSIAITYPPPDVTGDPTAPTTCAPASGSSFPVGRTNVACTARDLPPGSRAASCGFVVTIVPTIASTRFVGFGDSITAGTNDPVSCRFSAELDWSPAVGRYRLPVPSLVTDVPAAYPVVLQSLLRDRYLFQEPVVLDEGWGGERATGSDTLPRLREVLSAHMPQVLLLQEGANDLGIAQAPILVGALRSMIREAKGRGVRVFLGTLLPQRAGGCRGGNAEYVVPMNDQIRFLSASEGVDLVDLYQSFVASDLNVTLSIDGLHPTAAGYQLIANAFFGSIRTRLEIVP
jgi:lysophospholipase L1-like esterase